MKAAVLAKMEGKLRPYLADDEPSLVVSRYSKGRQAFVKMLKTENPLRTYNPPEELGRTLWGIRFRSPIMNAAGMFKDGHCYTMVAKQGAGAYLAGTTTANARRGNEENGVYLPFVPYPNSRAASNKLDLPNEGDAVVAGRLTDVRRIDNCPIGASVMGSPDLQGEKKLEALVHGMWLYNRAGVDFVEVNESCPNTAHSRPQDDALAERLDYVDKHFLRQRSRRLPVIVKFSNDTEEEQVGPLVDLLTDKGFDGVNFGNTSIEYAIRRANVEPVDRPLYDYFTQMHKGGVSGRPLKRDSLRLASVAVRHLCDHRPPREFHVIRTGGIETADDIRASELAGIPLNQWFTGYFDGFAERGHGVYRALYRDMLQNNVVRIPRALRMVKF